MNSATAPDAFFVEYTSQEAILKYTRATAGYGISYLLNHDYKAVYFDALAALPPGTKESGLRLLEFGCGGGMNLIHLVSLLDRGGAGVDAAVGTDFSPVLVDAARREAGHYLSEDKNKKLSFHVARNETLVSDLVSSMNGHRSALTNSFHFILGINTFRYCHRAQKQLDCARDIFDLLVPGGVCLVIDMNDRCFFFRDSLKTRFHLQPPTDDDCSIPSLEEYTAPFDRLGFDVLRHEHFCWIPHSSGQSLCHILASLSPVLNAVAKSRSMRSLVVARKPMASPDR